MNYLKVILIALLLSACSSTPTHTVESNFVSGKKPKIEVDSRNLEECPSVLSQLNVPATNMDLLLAHREDVLIYNECRDKQKNLADIVRKLQGE